MSSELVVYSELLSVLVSACVQICVIFQNGIIYVFSTSLSLKLSLGVLSKSHMVKNGFENSHISGVMQQIRDIIRTQRRIF